MTSRDNFRATPLLLCIAALLCSVEAHMPRLPSLVHVPEPSSGRQVSKGDGFTAKSAPGARREPPAVAGIPFDTIGGRYELKGRNAQGEGVSCPKVIQVGEVGKAPKGLRLEFGQKSGVVEHGAIFVDGVKCSSKGYVEFADIPEIGGQVDKSGKGVLAQVAVARDSEERVCGTQKFRGSFQFYDDMPRYASYLEDIGAVPRGGIDGARAGEVFFPLVQEPKGGDTMDAAAAYCWYKNMLKQTDAPKRKEVDEEEKESNSCFPGDASAELQDGSMVPMKHLNIGDVVKVGPGEYSRIFMFTHKLAGVRSEFVSIVTASGTSIDVSPGHYVYADGNLVPASDVRVGSMLVLGNGTLDAVTRVYRTLAEGLFNPQTVQGDIVVNNVLASTYTTAVAPDAAHSLLAPVRALYTWFGVSVNIFEAGSKLVPSLLPSGESWA